MQNFRQWVSPYINLLFIGGVLTIIVASLVNHPDQFQPSFQFGGAVLGLSFFTGGVHSLASRKDSKGQRLDLIQQLRTNMPQVVANTVEQLRKNGWLTNGTLRKQDLSRAQLQGMSLAKADFKGCDLRYARFEHASLQKADCSGTDSRWAHFNHTLAIQANFRNARLQQAQLRHATLTGADFRNADLRQADLRGADLSMADLRGADLYKANLQGVSFNHPQVVVQGAHRQNYTDSRSQHGQMGSARLDGNTRLPNGAYYDEDEGIDQLLRYTG